MSDPVLAEMMRRLKPAAPSELIRHTVWSETAMSRASGTITCKQRVVVLECGHTEVTTHLKRCKCRTCHAMILNGEDYEAFRRGQSPTSEGDDPC